MHSTITIKVCVRFPKRVCAIVSLSQVVLNVEAVCQLHQSVCGSLASEQAPLSLSVSILLSLSLLSLPYFSLIHGQAGGADAAGGG